MKAVNALKAVMACAIAIVAFHYAVDDAADTMVRAKADVVAAPAQPEREIMAAQTSAPVPAETASETAFGTPDPEFGQPHPAEASATMAMHDEPPMAEPASDAPVQRAGNPWALASSPIAPAAAPPPAAPLPRILR